MCGIVAISGRNNVVPRLIEGLRTLQYRGYDSAGLFASHHGTVDCRRAIRDPDRQSSGLAELEDALERAPLQGTCGIAHTRWATHGRVAEANTHPFVGAAVSVVHNGIIENYRAIRRRLMSDGVIFQSSTDTESALRLADRELAAGVRPIDAVHATIAELRGSFALVFAFHEYPGLLVAARRGSPLVVGEKDGEGFIASDPIALASHVDRCVYLENGDVAVIEVDAVHVETANRDPVLRPVSEVPPADASLEPGDFRHHMAREIHEQPEVLERLLALDQPIRADFAERFGARAEAPGAVVDLVACGTAHYAGMIGARWIESIGGVRAIAEQASEFRYRDTFPDQRSPAVFISQSGETADTLAAMRIAHELGRSSLGVVNSPHSSLAREADQVLEIHAGREIAVASTKAFTAQVATLLRVAREIANARRALSPDEVARIDGSLRGVPDLLREVLDREAEIRRIALYLADSNLVFYIGRGAMYPVALEGALKLKEITYIHAEGYPAGELKHGPIALIQSESMVIALAPRDRMFEKTVANMQEVIARDGRAVLVSDHRGIEEAGDGCVACIEVPECDEYSAPFIYTVALQLLAYHAALTLGTNPDMPRNLAKSVTVE